MSKRRANEDPEAKFSAQDLINASPSIVSVIDTDDWVVLYQNKAGDKMLGNIVGQSCHKNIANLDDICGFCRAHEAIKEKRTTAAEVERPDGQWLLIQWAPMRVGDQYTAVETITDITEQKRKEEEYHRLKNYFEHLANVDGLTGLLNRRGFNEMAQRLCQRLSRNDEPAHLLLLDIDHFKRVNDDYGHDAGDAALRQVAERITGAARVGDLLCRWGGEEFIILLQSTAADLRSVGERVCRTISSTPLVINGKDGELHIELTVSVGAVCFAAGDFEEALVHKAVNEADRRMLQAKQAGRNCVIAE